MPKYLLGPHVVALKSNAIQTLLPISYLSTSETMKKLKDHKG